MKIHEYQAKGLLAKHGVPVPRGEVAFSKDEAREIAKTLGGLTVVKAQIHAGGRGKGGGRQAGEDGRRSCHACRADARHEAGDTPDEDLKAEL